MGAEDRGVWPARPSPGAFAITAVEGTTAAQRVSDRCPCSHKASAENVFAASAGGKRPLERQWWPGGSGEESAAGPCGTGRVPQSHALGLTPVPELRHTRWAWMAAQGVPMNKPALPARHPNWIQCQKREPSGRPDSREETPSPPAG